MLDRADYDKQNLRAGRVALMLRNSSSMGLYGWQGHVLMLTGEYRFNATHWLCDQRQEKHVTICVPQNIATSLSEDGLTRYVLAEMEKAFHAP